MYGLLAPTAPSSIPISTSSNHHLPHRTAITPTTPAATMPIHFATSAGPLVGAAPSPLSTELTTASSVFCSFCSASFTSVGSAPSQDSVAPTTFVRLTCCNEYGSAVSSTLAMLENSVPVAQVASWEATALASLVD